MNVPALFKRAVAEFDRRVQMIDDDHWENTTPCPDWNVRDLVGHIVVEARWVSPLLEGKTIQEVGDPLDGDLDDPKAAWDVASREAMAAADRDGAMEVTAHLSFGDFPGHVYLSQVLADHVVHAWDLARGIGADDTLDPELVAFVDDFYAPQVELWRQAGAFGDPVEVNDDADRQTKLLAMVGRDPAK